MLLGGEGRRKRKPGHRGVKEGVIISTKWHYVINEQPLTWRKTLVGTQWYLFVRCLIYRCKSVRSLTWWCKFFGSLVCRGCSCRGLRWRCLGCLWLKSYIRWGPETNKFKGFQRWQDLVVRWSNSSCIRPEGQRFESQAETPFFWTRRLTNETTQIKKWNNYDEKIGNTCHLLPLFLEFIFHRTLWIISMYETDELWTGPLACLACPLFWFG